MAKDFEIITKHFPENHDIKIYPISDVHLGAGEHLKEEWETFLKTILEDPYSYVTLGGDLIDNGVRTSKFVNPFDQTMRPSTQKRMMVEMLKPLAKAGRILCAVSGNHEARSRKDCDDDITADIMCKLDLEDIYRENIAFVKLQIGNVDGTGTKNPTYIFAVTHGAGGGMLTGSAVNRNERFGYVVDGLDCLVVGHTHKPFVTQPSKIKIDPHNNKVTLRPFKVVSSSSWLGWGGYAASKMLLPQTYVPQVLTLCGNKKEIKVTM